MNSMMTVLERDGPFSPIRERELLVLIGFPEMYACVGVGGRFLNHAVAFEPCMLL